MKGAGARREAPAWLAALISFPQEESLSESWGRFLKLSATRAELLTLADLRRGRRLFLSFELDGERIENLPALCARARLDEDGYCLAELRFTERRRNAVLGRVLARLLASQ